MFIKETICTTILTNQSDHIAELQCQALERCIV